MRKPYELMPVATSDPQLLLEDVFDAHKCSKEQLSLFRCERIAPAEKPYDSSAEPRHRLGNDLEPTR
jgi:hypothetical protein